MGKLGRVATVLAERSCSSPPRPCPQLGLLAPWLQKAGKGIGGRQPGLRIGSCQEASLSYLMLSSDSSLRQQPRHFQWENFSLSSSTAKHFPHPYTPPANAPLSKVELPVLLPIPFISKLWGPTPRKEGGSIRGERPGARRHPLS